MLGPAQIELITLGARWPPCMKTVEAIPLTFPIACANTTSLPATSFCTIESICAFGGFNGQVANQWWRYVFTLPNRVPEPMVWLFRFFTAIFIHAGLVHLALNMFAQWSLCGQVEQEMGSPSFLVLYLASGLFGNVLGGNFALVGVPSVSTLSYNLATTINTLFQGRRLWGDLRHPSCHVGGPICSLGHRVQACSQGELSRVTPRFTAYSTHSLSSTSSNWLF